LIAYQLIQNYAVEQSALCDFHHEKIGHHAISGEVATQNSVEADSIASGQARLNDQCRRNGRGLLFARSDNFQAKVKSGGYRRFEPRDVLGIVGFARIG
jgi:hypothetical protein